MLEEIDVFSDLSRGLEPSFRACGHLFEQSSHCCFQLRIFSPADHENRVKKCNMKIGSHTYNQSFLKITLAALFENAEMSM